MPDRCGEPGLLPRGFPTLAAFFRFRLMAGGLILAAALSPPPTARPAPSSDESPEIQRDYEKVANEVLCWCGCARQSLRDCTCGFSYEVRGKLEADLKAGRTPEAIIAALVAEQGDQVRVVPLEQGFDRLAFIGPGIAIALGALFVLLVMRRWIRPAPPVPKPVPTEADLVRDDEYRARVAKTLSRMDS